MSEAKKNLVLFCAEYLVVIQGLLFLICVLQGENVSEKSIILFSGLILLIVTLTVAKIIKKIIHKRRPLKKTELFVPFDRYAFPSAHSASLFSITVFILSQHLWLGVVSLITTLLIVIARVESRVHDYLDIAGGFVIGVGITYYLAPYVLTYVTIYLVPSLLISV